MGIGRGGGGRGGTWAGGTGIWRWSRRLAGGVEGQRSSSRWDARAAVSYLLLGSWNFLSAARFLGFLNSSICSGDGPGASCVESGSRSRYAACVSTGAAAAASAEYHLLGQSGLDCRDICETRSCRSGRTVSLQLAILFDVSRCLIGRRSYTGQACRCRSSKFFGIVHGLPHGPLSFASLQQNESQITLSIQTTFTAYILCFGY